MGRSPRPYNQTLSERNSKASTKLNAQTFDSVCKFLSKTYDRPGRLEAALLGYLTLSQGKGSVRDLITTRTNKIGILNRLGATPLNEDLDRALVLRALSAPLSEYIASRHHHLKYSVNEIFRIAVSVSL
jgi:hypothetical protein